MAVTTGITVPGAAGGNIIVSTGTGDYLKLAQQMATVLNGARSGSSLTLSVVGAGSTVPTATPTKNTTELAVTGAGGVATHTEGSGWNYIVNVTSSPDTIVASNTQVLSGDAGATILVSGTSTVAATGGNNFVNATGTYLISTSTGNDTVFASGSGTVAAGAGANFVSVSAGASSVGNYVISAGTGDVIRQASGNASVNALGTNATVTGSTGGTDALVVTLGGSGNQLFTQATHAQVTVSGTSNQVSGGTGALTALVSGTSDTVVAGSGTANVTVAGNGGVVFGNAASTGGTMNLFATGSTVTASLRAETTSNVTLGGSNSAIFGGTGTANIVVTGGSDTVALGSGTSAVKLTGGNSAFFGNTTGGGTANVVDRDSNVVLSTRAEGLTNITVSGSNVTTYGGSGNLNMSINGANDTVYAGTGAETVQANNNDVVYGAASNTLNFIGVNTSATPTVSAGAGGTTLITVGGSGGLRFNTGGNDNSTIVGGVGQVTVFGTSGTVVNYVGAATTGGARFQAYAGNETLSGAGSAAANGFYGSASVSSSDVFLGGTGADLMIAGAGNTTMTGGAGSDIFATFLNATSANGSGAHITITDFTRADDVVYIINYDQSKSASYLQANASGPGVQGTGAGVTLTLSDNTTITFTNLTSVGQLNGRILYGHTTPS